MKQEPTLEGSQTCSLEWRTGEPHPYNAGGSQLGMLHAGTKLVTGSHSSKRPAEAQTGERAEQ